MDIHAEAEALARKLSPKMRAVLPAVIAAGEFQFRGLAHLPAGVTYPSLEALVRRGLVEEYETGETVTGYEGKVFKIRRYRVTDQGHAVAAVISPAAPAEADATLATVEQPAAEEGNHAQVDPHSLEALADTVICPTCHVGAGARCITRAGRPARDPHGRRFGAVEDAAGITQHREGKAREGWVIGLDRKAEAALLTAYAARINTRARRDEEQPAEQAPAEEITAARARSEAAALDDQRRIDPTARELLAAADTAGTWRDGWIGEHTPTHDADDGTLFPAVEAAGRRGEQAALFTTD